MVGFERPLYHGSFLACFNDKGRGESRIASRIDRGILNSQWMLK